MGRIEGAEERGGIVKENHRYRIAELYLRGWTQTEIATELEISQATVNGDLSKIRERWRSSALVMFNERESAELEKIDALEAMYVEGFRRSLEKKRIKTTRSVPVPDKETGKVDTKNLSFIAVEESLREELSVGDARWLEGINKCIDQRCRILGLYRTTPASAGSGDSTETGQSVKGRVSILLAIFEQFGQNQAAGQIRAEEEPLEPTEP